MARRAAAPLPYRFVAVGQKIIQTDQLTSADIDQLRALERDGKVRCPTCRGPMTLLADPGGSVAMHRAPNPYAGHEPEDREMRQAKRLIAARLRSLFPSAPIELDVHIPEIERLADIVLLTPYGGRIAVEVQAADMRAEDVAELQDLYESIGVRCLWLLDSRRLRTTQTPAPTHKILKTMIEPAETGLVRIGEPIIYLDAARREIIWVRPNPLVRELAQLGDPRIGRVESLVRGYPLTQLRVKQGAWCVPTEFDKRPPKPPALPANLVKRLDKLRVARDLSA